jgi:hypothetical protein
MLRLEVKRRIACRAPLVLAPQPPHHAPFLEHQGLRDGLPGCCGRVQPLDRLAE